MDVLIEQGTCLISAAQGEVTPGPADKPLLIVAGGTGIAQGFSCAEHRAGNTTEPATAPTTVLWCADCEDEFYLQEAFAGWGTQLVTIADDRRTAENEGLLWLRDHARIYRDATVIIAGAPPFVYAATDTFLAQGFTQNMLQSDVYAYAPR